MNWMSESDRDWKEDFDKENGNYQCVCSICGEFFTGYKRRSICKVCSDKGLKKKITQEDIDNVVKLFGMDADSEWVKLMQGELDKERKSGEN